jgi:hypothetical protein
MAQVKTALTRRTESQIDPNTIISGIAIISGIILMITSLYLLIKHIKTSHQNQAKILEVLLFAGGLILTLFGIRQRDRASAVS